MGKKKPKSKKPARKNVEPKPLTPEQEKMLQEYIRKGGRI
jgi:hypothetical protein